MRMPSTNRTVGPMGEDQMQAIALKAWSVWETCYLVWGSSQTEWNLERPSPMWVAGPVSSMR